VGETLFSVAPKYNIDWMLLWSLNGGDSPDTVTQTGAPYRFAHQYTIQEGDTLASIAHNLATTPEAIMKLNFNRITHFASLRDLLPGTTICVLPSFIDVRYRIPMLMSLHTDVSAQERQSFRRNDDLWREGLISSF
jgi:spore germination protein YaaH